MTRTRWTIPALLLAAGLAAACGGAPRTFEKPPRPVRVEAAAAPASGRGAHYSAHVEPREKVPLAFKVGGYVAEILKRRRADGRPAPLQAGDEIPRDTVLARIVDEDYRAAVDQAKGALGQASAARTKATLDFERATHLYETKSVTRAEFDAAKAGLDAAEAQAAVARGQLDQAESALRNCSLRAPMNGVLLDRSVEEGRLVAAGTVAFVIADVSSVKVIFGVPDTIVSSLRPGQTMRIATESLPASSFEGTITAVAPSADSQSRVFQVEVTVPNPGGSLKVGMIAAVEMGAADGAGGAIAAGAGPLVPLTAIVKSSKGSGGYSVFVVEGDAETAVARERAVTLGGVVGNRIAVDSGVRQGERAIVTGATLVVDGERVRVIP